MRTTEMWRSGWVLGVLVLFGSAQAALAEGEMPMPPPSQQQPAMPGMGGMGGMGGGGGMAMEKMEMGGMGMKPGAMESMGNQRMGQMDGSAAMQSPLPGFPGASHLYHVGSSDFFLDHGEMVSLTVEQKQRLGQIRERSQMESATFDRRILEAEQELWRLTAADQPDATAIETKVREIETLRGDQRLAFIRTVGNAAEVLTPAQRQKALGVTGK